jgi:hypothetical protein
MTTDPRLNPLVFLAQNMASREGGEDFISPLSFFKLESRAANRGCYLDSRID